MVSWKYDPGCSRRIRVSDPDPDYLSIPDPGQKGNGSPITDPQLCKQI